MVQKYDVTETSISWAKVKPESCGEVANANGCTYAFYPMTAWGNHCAIVMPKDSSDSVVAEEFRHCFGYVHKDTK